VECFRIPPIEDHRPSLYIEWSKEICKIKSSQYLGGGGVAKGFIPYLSGFRSLFTIVMALSRIELFYGALISSCFWRVTRCLRGWKVKQVHKVEPIAELGLLRTRHPFPSHYYLAGKCHVYRHSVCGMGNSKVAYLSQLQRFKLSLPFNSFLPHVAVINLLLYKPPPLFPPYFRVAWDLDP
jgi:hypothetical protein